MCPVAETKEAPLIELRGITKVFPGVVANDDISITLRKGEIHALVGENGAGKTTLMKILYGEYKPDKGEIRVKGQPVRITGPSVAISHGIGMVHQHFMLVPGLTVLENIILGSEPAKGGVLDTAEARKKIEAIMAANAMPVDLDVDVEKLPVGLQQRVEILKLLYRGAETLILDEPTAVLTPQETNELFKTLRALKEQGKGIIFISHKLDEVIEIADRITVVRRGRIVGELPVQEATKAKIAEMMVGKPVLMEIPVPEVNVGDEVLTLEDVTFVEDGVKKLDGITLTVRSGEIYGVAGVEGNGQEELLKVVSGEYRPTSGKVMFGKQAVNSLDPLRRRRLGLGHIPADRQKQGLFINMPLYINAVVGWQWQDRFSRRGILNYKNMRTTAKEVVEKYDVRTPSVEVPANALSGGNQQKFIVGREISFDPTLLVAAYPTRGVDIGATEFIYRQLLEEKSRGKAVLLVSADLDELLTLSDRIGVLYRGRIVKEFSREEVTPEKIGFYMLGGREE
ncbi:ABC transporter ATP-binding protein [Coprothermobacteraceae bacterium]|nr:ABC transporter ATP-binding protein [Coprothermobacteraceae bacterium]